MMMCVVLQQVPAQFDKLENRVRKALGQDEPYRALMYAERALTRSGAPPVFHVLKAEALNRIGEYAKGLAELKKAGPALTGDSEYRTNLIGCLTALGLLDSARTLIDPVVPEDVSEEYAYRAGRVYAVQRQWKEAYAWFDAGAQRYQNSVRLLRERGACHAMLGDSAKARADLDRAIELAPRQAANYNSRGYYRYMMFGDYQRAMLDMDRAIKHDPNYGYAFSNRGWCAFKLGNAGKARRDLDLAVRKNPGNAYAHRSLGIIEVQAGNTVKACSHFRKALELGYTVQYGNEVEALTQQHCANVPEPAPAPVAPQPKGTPPSNAPGERARDRSNAP